MNRDKKIWLTAGAVFAAGSSIAYVLLSGIAINFVYPMPVENLLTTAGIDIPILGNIFFIISICIFSVSTALLLDAFSSGRLSAFLSFVFTVTSVIALARHNISPLQPASVGLCIIGIYYAMLSRKNIRKYKVGSKSPGILSGPQAGRSAIRSHNRISSPLIMKELVVSSSCFLISGFLSPIGIVISIGVGIFTLSCMGSFFVRIARTLLFVFISSIPVFLSVGIRFLHGDFPAFQKSSTILIDASTSIKNGFLDSLFFGLSEGSRFMSIIPVSQTVMKYILPTFGIITASLFIVNTIRGVLRSLQSGSPGSDGHFPYFGNYAFNLPSSLAVAALIFGAAFLIFPVIDFAIVPLYGYILSDTLYCMGYTLSVFTAIMILEGSFLLVSGLQGSKKRKPGYVRIAAASLIVVVSILPRIIEGWFLWK